jgi:DNA-directed RNA polymerase specialized sigma24 family protein
MFGLIQSLDLTADEKNALSEKIAEANLLLRDKAEERYGEPRVKRLRHEYVKHVRGKHLFRFDAETRAFLEVLMGLESTVLSAYIRMAMELVQAFYLSNRRERPHLDENDYLQEATWALFDSIYCYDGSTQFSTYAYNAVKRRLAGFVRDEETHAGIGRDVKQLRRKVREIMRQQMCRVEEAILALRQMEEMSDEMAAQVRDAMYTVSYIEKDTHQSTPVEADSDQTSALRAAVKLADLSPIQRELIESYLQTGERIDSELVAGRVNPNTGKKYTRQALSQQWAKACDKIKAVMEEREPVAA